MVPGGIGPPGPTGDSAGKIYYPDPLDASDIAGLKTLLDDPSPNAETTLTAAMVGTGDNLLETFATNPGSPGVTAIPAGTATRHIYVSTGADNQLARLKIELYKCAFDGTGQVLLRTDYSPNFSGATIQDLIWNLSDSNNFAILATDRLIAKLYGARVSGPATCNLTVYFDGTTHTSFVQSTITVGPSGTKGADGVSMPGPPGQDAEEPEIPYIIPGSPGAASTVPGPPGFGMPGPPGQDAEESEMPYIIPGNKGNDGAASTVPGPAGISTPGPPGQDAEEPEIPYIIPGSPGAPSTVPGPAGMTVPGPPGQDAEESEIPYIIPGSPGAASTVPGPPGFGMPGPPGQDAEESEMPYIIPGKDGKDGTPGTPGTGGSGSGVGPPGQDAEEAEIPFFVAGPGGTGLPVIPVSYARIFLLMGG
jgi:hypothetical protein